MYWDTADHPLDDQFSYWADVVCEAFTPLAPARTRQHLARSRHTEGLQGWVRSALLASTNCAEIASCTQRLTHGATEVRRSPADVVFVNLQLTGLCKGEQDGRRCLVPPGTFALFDTTRPYRLEFEESRTGEPWRVLSFRVRRDQLTRFLPGDAQFTGRTVDGQRGAGLVVSTMMASIWTTQEELSPSTRLAVDHAYGQVLVTALGAFELSGAPDRVGRDAALRSMLTRFVAERLPLGSIRAEDAAAHVGVSIRKVHELFAGTGTSFASVVREMRLREVTRDLLDDTAPRSITEIASRWGFCDGAHLSRVFRAEFGCTPSEYRLQQGRGTSGT